MKRPIQTQRFTMSNNDEDLLILSLNESLREEQPKKLVTHSKSRVNHPSTISADSEEQNLLKDIFFIC